MRTRLVILVLVLVTAALGVQAALAKPAAPAWFSYRGVVVNVVDGDTLDAKIGPKRERVRLIGVDTPEVGDCYAAEATAKAGSLALHKKVRLVGDRSQARRDRYGRLLAYVILPDGTDLARTLIAGGYGTVYVYDKPFARLRAYELARDGAITSNLGLLGACPLTIGAVVPAPPTTTTAPPRGNCDPSYPGVCIPPAPPDLDCKDVPYKDFVVLPPDPHRFDGDHNGRGCQS